MNIIVSTFPPLQDGIARYAGQQVTRLRKQGEAVLTVGLAGSEADIVLDLLGGWKPLRLLRCRRAGPVLGRSARLVIHWHDHLFYTGGFSRRIPTDLALRWVLRAFPDTEIICHETYPLPPASDPIRGLFRRAHQAGGQALWRAASRVVFHSPPERAKMEAAVGIRLEDRRVEIRDHGAFFDKYREVDQGQARGELGIPAQAVVFLCIGFLGESKGFHRALEAFRSVSSPEARLYVVGSALSIYDPEPARAYIRRLCDIAAQTPNATVVEKFVSDQEFDTWIAACDYLLAPYERAFSSSVIERAKLFEKPVIASAVGGLPDQLTGRDVAFSSDEELASALRRCVAERGGRGA